MTGMNVAREALHSVSMLLPVEKIIPESVREGQIGNAEFYLVREIQRAKGMYRLPPFGSSLTSSWGSLQQNIAGAYKRTFYEVLPLTEVSDFSQEICGHTDKMYVEDAITMRDRVRNFLMEPFAFHLEIIVAHEMRKIAKLPEIHEHDDYVVQLLRGYAVGGWPCGWEGSYPTGRMMLFFPYDSIGRWNHEEVDFD